MPQNSDNKPRGHIFVMGLYMEGVFRFKSSFLKAPGLIQDSASRKFTGTCSGKSKEIRK